MGAKGTHPSNGVVKARQQGMPGRPAWVLTIPTVVAEHFDFESTAQWFRAELRSDGSILYRPVEGPEHRPVPMPEPRPARIPGDYPKRLPAT
jgi:hypothetical protein